MVNHKDFNCPWEDHAYLVNSLVADWLGLIGVEEVSEHSAMQALQGKTLVIPHESWAYNGLSGSSTPPFIGLDYSNQVASLMDQSSAKDMLSAQSLSLSAKVHYGAFNNLCGTKTDNCSLKVSDVTCPHCITEIMVRVQPVSVVPS